MSTQRDLPTESINGLKPPVRGFPYFQGVQQFPFESQATEISQANASWLADACLMVYGDSDFVGEAFAGSPLPDAGIELQWIGSEAENRGMVLSCKEFMLVVFRGTRLNDHSVSQAAAFQWVDLGDFLTDSKFVLTNHPIEGRVHRGFLAAYQEVNESLARIIKAKRSEASLWFSGHSLGGALAVLAATEFSESVAGVYTFGAPRVGDQAFAELLPAEKQFRFVHRDDWISRIPPELISYQHGGVEFKIPGSGERRFWDDVSTGAKTFVDAVKSTVKELKIDFGDFPMQISGIADHAPAYYAVHLWNELVSPTETSAKFRQNS